MALSKLSAAAAAVVGAALMSAPAFAAETAPGADPAAPAEAPAAAPAAAPAESPAAAPAEAPVMKTSAPAAAEVSPDASASDVAGATGSEEILAASGSAVVAASDKPASGGLDLSFLKYWPPHLPPLMSLHGVMGPRFGNTTNTYVPAFKQTGSSTPDTKTPQIGNETANTGSFGGEAEFSIDIPILGPAVGLQFDGGRSTAGLTVSSPDTSLGTTPLPDVMPSGSWELYGKLLGLQIGLRNETFDNGFLNVTGKQSVTEYMGGYDLKLGLGPVEAAAGGQVGFGQGTNAVVIPADGRACLAVKVWGLKLEGGFHGHASAVGGDAGKAMNVASTIFGSNTGFTSSTDPATAVKDAKESARLSVEWGPYIQAGISF